MQFKGGRGHLSQMADGKVIEQMLERLKRKEDKVVDGKEDEQVWREETEWAGRALKRVVNEDKKQKRRKKKRKPKNRFMAYKDETVKLGQRREDKLALEEARAVVMAAERQAVEAKQRRQALARHAGVQEEYQEELRPRRRKLELREFVQDRLATLQRRHGVSLEERLGAAPGLDQAEVEAEDQHAYMFVVCPPVIGVKERPDGS